MSLQSAKYGQSWSYNKTIFVQSTYSTWTLEILHDRRAPTRSPAWHNNWNMCCLLHILPKRTGKKTCKIMVIEHQREGTVWSIRTLHRTQWVELLRVLFAKYITVYQKYLVTSLEADSMEEWGQCAVTGDCGGQELPNVGNLIMKD